MEIRVNSISDEAEEWFINDKSVITANHDDHGWAGMESIRNVFVIFAKELGVTISYTEDHEE